MSTVAQSLPSACVNAAPLPLVEAPEDLRDLLEDVAARAQGVALIVTPKGDLDRCEMCPTGGAFDPSDGVAIVAHRTGPETFLYRDAVCAEHAVAAINDAAGSGQQVWIELPYGPAPRLADVIPLQSRRAGAVAGAR